MESLAQSGVGVFPALTALLPDIEQLLRVRMIGESECLSVRFYAISAERRLGNLAVAAMQDEARQQLFPE